MVLPARDLEAANAAIVNYHHRLPLTQAFGTGTLSSSDGQRFPVKGKSITARHLSRYFARGQGISTYTHVSDQHSTFDTKVIVATASESHDVLDGILGNETDLPITEHATDTAGATVANFALFDLVGRQLSLRIRDLGKITLDRTGPRAEFADRYPRCGPLLTRRLNTDLITSMGDDLLRVAASVQGGHATAALVVGKLCSSKRQQNALTSAIKEYGALRRTVYAARYLADETYRRRIAWQLNKGENLHALRRCLAYAGEGAVRRRTTSSRPSRCGASHWRPTRSSPGPPSTTAWPSPRYAEAAGGSTTKSSPTSGRPTTRTSTSTAPTRSTSTASWPSSRRRVPAAARHTLNCRPPVRGRRGGAMRRSTGVMLADVSDTSELDASVLAAEVVGLLNGAECYIVAPEDEQLEYLHRRAALLHRLVDVLGDEPSRSLAQDADDRARRARAVSPLEDPRSRNAR